ncbi:MAG TPA: hypothetical protein VD928_02285 [Candidatus Paceibacterota bacterium]|nr:hypothetical protein [Candidatus Paceibacterota bacterium]
MHRKGYGLDWKSEIKKDLVEYTSRGRIPMDALKFSSARIREAELRVWSDSYIEELKQAVVPETARLMAAE